MKKCLFAVLLLLTVFPILASAESLLRYNYKKNGYIYTGTERVRVTGSQMPLQLKLERVSFPDGAALFVMHIDFEDNTSWTVPQNAPITFTLEDGKSLVSKSTQIISDMVNQDGIKTSEGTTVYWNCAEFYFESADIKKLISGVKSLEMVKRWSTDGRITITYKNDEFAEALSRQYQAIVAAETPKEEVGNMLKSIQDANGSRFITTNISSIDSRISVSLSYIYYAATNNENYDLNLFLPDVLVPVGSEIVITTFDGEEISLQQEKPLEKGFVICYPTIAQLKSIIGGVSKIVVSTGEGTETVAFQNMEFSRMVEKLYNSIQTASIL